MTLDDRFRAHAERMSPGLYRTLLFAMADDLQAGGVTARICSGYADAPAGSVIQLRLLAGLQRLVLSRRAPELAFYYPNLGGEADPSSAWPVFRDTMEAHLDELRAGLEIAPQTNEPGRSVALLVGLFDAVRRSGLSDVRLLEPGASAGLNLLVDRFRIGGEAWAAGPSDSPLQLLDAVVGPVQPAECRIVSRRGCDLSPVDPTDPEGRLRLTSFVWPHHLDRYERLRAALAVAAVDPAPVDRAGAAEWLTVQLADPAPDGVLTVVWHSVTAQYWPESEVAAVFDAIAEAGSRMPIAHITMEHYVESLAPAELRVAVAAPGHDRVEVRVAEVGDHGVPVTLLPV